MAFGFFRGIWIALRAVNYTNRAFAEVAKNLGNLQKAELDLIKRTGNLMQVGMIFIAVGGLVSSGIMEMINKSKLGGRYMEKFSETLDKSLAKIGGEIFTMIKPILDLTKAILELIGSNPALTHLAATFLLILGPVVMLAGAVVVLGSAYRMLANEAIVKAIASMLNLNIATKISEMGMKNLALATGAALGVFAAVYAIITSLYPVLGKLGTILVGVAVAVIGLAVAIAAMKAAAGDFTGIAFLGAALAAGGAMSASFAASQPEFAMGTSFVRKTGYAKVHVGEEIRSARESRIPSKIEKQGTTINKRRYDVQINIGTLHTKASKEEMVDAIRNAMRSVT